MISRYKNKEDQQEYAKNHYLANKVSYIEASYKRNKIRRQISINYIDNYLYWKQYNQDGSKNSTQH